MCNKDLLLLINKLNVLSDTKDQDTVSLNERIEYFDEMKRPLWYVYSGMGSR